LILPYSSNAISLRLYAPPIEKTIGKTIAVAIKVNGKLAVKSKYLHP
jgi:hypothetical protein